MTGAGRTVTARLLPCIAPVPLGFPARPPRFARRADGEVVKGEVAPVDVA